MRIKLFFFIGFTLLISACGNDQSTISEQKEPRSNTIVKSENTSPPQSESSLTDSKDSLVKEEASTEGDELISDENEQPISIDADAQIGGEDTLDISKINSIGSWKFGTPFSQAKTKLERMEIGYDATNKEYTAFHNNDYFLTFYKGLLFEITVSEKGKGIPGLVVVGDNEASVINKIGSPLTKMDYGDSIDYDYGSYAEPPLSVRIKDNKVVAIRMYKDTEGDQKEQHLLLDFIKKPTETTQEEAPLKQAETKMITFDEYVKISESVLNALVQYTQIMSKDIPDNEKLEKVKEIDSKYEIYDLSLMLENAIPADEQDKDLHNRCKQFVDKVESLFTSGMFFLSVKINGDDKILATSLEKQARIELQDVWAWVNKD